MRILITGACGFVGTTLAEALLDFCDPGALSLVGIDNLSRPGSWLNRQLLKQRGITVHHGDVRLASDLENIGPCEAIVDCAANPSVLAGTDGKSSSRQLVEHNLQGTINLLEACKLWNASFTLLSTSRVYSIPPLADLTVEVRDGAYVPVFGDAVPGLSPLGIAETFSTAPPVSLYGSTKLASETLALEYGLTFGFPVWINRCGVMAGAGQFGKPDQGIFAFWIHSWRENKPLKYIGFDGLGHQVRDCLHPRDLAPLLAKQLGLTPGSPGGPPTPPALINLSGGCASAMSLRQLSAWCADRFPRSSTGQSLPESTESLASEISRRPFDLPWVVLDASRAAGSWQWAPATPMDALLEEIATFAERQPDWLSACS